MYVRERVKERIINGRKVTIIVRANRPSPEALRRFAETWIRIKNEMEAEKEGRG